MNCLLLGVSVADICLFPDGSLGPYAFTVTSSISRRILKYTAHTQHNLDIIGIYILGFHVPRHFHLPSNHHALS